MTLLFCDVNVDCEVFFSDPECEFVESQDLLSRKRKASVVLERDDETDDG